MFHPGIVALLVWLAGVGVLWGAEPPAAVRSLGQGRFQIGLVTFDKTNRTVTFPAVVHLREATVEYIVVHKTGKTHESVLTTEAQPQDVHLALLLLGCRAAETNRFGEDGLAPPPGERVSITASWTNAAALTNCPIEDLVLDKETGHPPVRGPWTFNGSNFSEGLFTAQRDGSILSLHIDPDALLNNPRPGRRNDDLHRPNAVLLPDTGAAVTITIEASPRR